MDDTKNLLATIKSLLEDKKATNIIEVDLSKTAAIVDYMIIASADSGRQINAIVHYLKDKLRELGIKNLETEGIPQCNWVIVEIPGQVMIHLFRPEVREFYNIEEIWVPRSAAS